MGSCSSSSIAMGSCKSIPVAVVVQIGLGDSQQSPDSKPPDSKPATCVTPPDQVSMADTGDQKVIKTINEMVERFVRCDMSGTKQMCLVITELEKRLQDLFGADYVDSLVNVQDIRKQFESAGWTFVPDIWDERFMHFKS